MMSAGSMARSFRSLLISRSTHAPPSPTGFLSDGKCCALARTAHSLRCLSTASPGDRPVPRKNPDLLAVKNMGLSHLEATATEVAAKTRKSLFSIEEELGPSPDQLSEANRILDVASKALEALSQRDTTFSIQGNPIILLDVEVSRDMKLARVYWTLPYTLFHLPEKVRAEITARMQAILERHGGRLQVRVHAVLRSYYPPKLRFIPANDEIMREAMNIVR